jgi:hypothetical protein
MNSREYRELQEAYFGVYDELDEAKVDKVVDKTLEQHGIDPDTRMMVKQGSRKSRKTSESPRRTNTQVKLAHLRSRYDHEIDEEEQSPMPPRRSAAERKKRAQELGDKQTIRGVVSGYNKTRQPSRQEDPEKYYPKEQYDLHDAILSHLLDEGYADTLEAAEGIMVSMSEEWRESIVEVTGGGKVEYKPIFRGPSGRSGGRVMPNKNQDPQRRGMSSYPGHKTADKIDQLKYEKSKTPKGSEERKKLETRVGKLQSRFDRDGKEHQDYV